DRDSILVQHRCHVVRMNVCKVETDNSSTGLGVCRPVHLQALHSSQCFKCIPRYFPVVVPNVPETQFCQVIGCCSKPDRSGNVGGSGFELEGRVFECGFVQMDLFDHFSATLIGLHCLPELSLSVQDPYSGGSARLV